MITRLPFLPTGCRGVTPDRIYEAARKVTDEMCIFAGRLKYRGCTLTLAGRILKLISSCESKYRNTNSTSCPFWKIETIIYLCLWLTKNLYKQLVLIDFHDGRILISLFCWYILEMQKAKRIRKATNFLIKLCVFTSLLYLSIKVAKIESRIKPPLSMANGDDIKNWYLIGD